MSCQQNQQQCQPPPKCTPKCPSPKCPPKSPAQCLPPALSGCALSSGGGCGPSSSEGGCCLSHHRHHHRSHRCRRQSSESCDTGSGQHPGASGCGHHGSGGCC
ncbi:late cornified envelope protein 3D-like [Myotis daubentonii]|uniref:late cornified envelope protein 3D-like n=1 Tax=Myotis daubentonii TaxID=98922 RepID=UPI0028738FCC|nr:late cornified envelope protein 3D-like [Myotis daubentonii]